MIKGGEQLNRWAKVSAKGRHSSLRQSAFFLEKKLGPALPQLALVLGSGFQRVLDGFRIEAELDVAEIAGFPVLRVQGHSGRLLVANIEGLRILVLLGRAHYYEGHRMEAVMFPV